LVLPGVKESKAVTKVLTDAADQGEDQHFMKYLLFAVKQKNYMLVIMAFLFFQVFTNTAVGSMPFFVMNVLGFESEDPMMQMLLAEFALVFISIPVWSKIIKKHGFNWAFVASGVIVAAASLSLLFAQDLLQSTIIFALLGFAVGGFIALQSPMINNVVDELTVKLGQRKEGIFFGIHKFFERFSLVIGGFIVAIVRSVTHFDPQNPATFTDAALFGIRIEMVGVGALLLIVALLVFRKFFDLTPEKMEKVREELAVIDGIAASD
jgi:GPH family glycoside/pentoside/hexuronide:cation symporter